MSNHHLTQLLVSTHLVIPDCDNQISFFNTRVLYAMGVHPWYVEDVSFQKLLLEQYQNASISAIGEIGLDFYPNFVASKELQLLFFKQQLRIAEKLNLAVSIHCRAAFPELLKILSQHELKGVLHGFMGSFEQAKPFIKLGYKIGMNGVVCYENARKYHRLATEIPLASLVLESDYPFVRQKDGTPILVDQVASSIALLRDMALEELVDTTYATASQLFIRI